MDYLSWLTEECGYLEVKPLASGRWAAIMPFMFTHAIILGRMGDATGYADRWCYENLDAAKAALNAWDGAAGTEPTGWHRHPGTGRRVSQSPEEFDADDRRVGKVGVLYQRW